MPTLEEIRKLLSSPEFCKPPKREEFKVKPKIPEIEYSYIDLSGHLCLASCAHRKGVRIGSNTCLKCFYRKNPEYNAMTVECSYLRDKALEKNHKTA
jgi:hypothetical protein